MKNKKIQPLNSITFSIKEKILSIILFALFILFYVSNPIVLFIKNTLTTNQKMILTYSIDIIKIILIFFIYKKHIKNRIVAWKIQGIQYIKNIFISIIFSYILPIMLITFLIILGIDIPENSANQKINLELIQMYSLYTLSIVIISPIFEETLFRGFLRKFIKNDILFIITSALLFGLAHTLGRELTFYYMLINSIYYTIIGAILAYSYTKTNNLIVNILIHILRNLLAII